MRFNNKPVPTNPNPLMPHPTPLPTDILHPYGPAANLLVFIQGAPGNLAWAMYSQMSHGITPVAAHM